MRASTRQLVMTVSCGRLFTQPSVPVWWSTSMMTLLPTVKLLSSIMALAPGDGSFR